MLVKSSSLIKISEPAVNHVIGVGYASPATITNKHGGKIPAIRWRIPFAISLWHLRTMLPRNVEWWHVPLPEGAAASTDWTQVTSGQDGIPVRRRTWLPFILSRTPLGLLGHANSVVFWCFSRSSCYDLVETLSLFVRMKEKITRFCWAEQVSLWTNHAGWHDMPRPTVFLWQRVPTTIKPVCFTAFDNDPLQLLEKYCSLVTGTRRHPSKTNNKD